MARELFSFGNEYVETHNNQAADMWARGEIAFQLLTGEPAFKDQGALFDYHRRTQSLPTHRLAFAGERWIQFISNPMAAKPELRLHTADAPWPPLDDRVGEYQQTENTYPDSRSSQSGAGASKRRQPKARRFCKTEHYCPYHEYLFKTLRIIEHTLSIQPSRECR